MKKLLSLFIILCMIFSLSVTNISANNGAVFNDVDSATEIGKSIYKLYSAGIVSGNGDGTFTPNNSITRAEFCKMINKTWNLTIPDTTQFSDVTQDKWYYNDVLIAKKAGYIAGFGDGTFRGDEYVTREQVCTIIYRIAGLYDLDIPVTITDEISDWAVPYVKAVVANRIISLEEGNTFRATENMKRGEVAQTVSVFVQSSAPSISGGSSGGGGGSGGSGGSLPGGNTPGGDNTGGDNTGGDNTGGDNTGGDNTGGDNTGGDNTGGDDTPTPPEEPEQPTMTPEDYLEANDEALSHLEALYNTLSFLKGNIYRRGTLSTLIGKVMSNTNTIIGYGDNAIIDDYLIFNLYLENEQIRTDSETVQELWASLASDTKETFANNLLNCDEPLTEGTINYIASDFGSLLPEELFAELNSLLNR